ncbi:methyltransferase family protein [candidate division CSSED10-310 bacterium]|uniref:Methyltransferase family protein n=1 Tax=candidate division CSSED10-310 bacterium TaxID=2855610 RepID=A0ABV6YW57_UNCC1
MPQNLTSSSLKRISNTFLFLFVQAYFFFYAAGHVALPRAWLYFGLVFFVVGINVTLLAIFKPKLLNQRGATKNAEKSWDRWFFRLIPPCVIALSIISGLDIGRYHWSEIPAPFTLIGVIFIVLSAVLMNWAMLKNPHFEVIIRIQHERDHQVIQEGPYRYLRHPGYTSAILLYSSCPFIIGSVWAFIPVTMLILLYCFRTSLEDRLLQQELPGYSDYVEKVRYRLFPGLW